SALRSRSARYSSYAALSQRRSASSLWYLSFLFSVALCSRAGVRAFFETRNRCQGTVQPLLIKGKDQHPLAVGCPEARSNSLDYLVQELIPSQKALQRSRELSSLIGAGETNVLRAFSHLLENRSARILVRPKQAHSHFHFGP